MQTTRPPRRRHAGASPAPLLPGLTAGSPARQRGQSTPAVRRQVERPQRTERIHAPGYRRRQRRHPAGTVHEHEALDDLAAQRLDRRDHRQQRAAGREDVVHDEDLLARPTWNPRRNSRRRPSSEATSSAKIARVAQLAPRLEGEDHAPGRGAGDEVHVRGPVLPQVEPTQKSTARSWPRDPGGPGTSRGTRPVATALEDEVALPQRAAPAEQRLGALGDRPARGFVERASEGGHRGYSKPSGSPWPRSRRFRQSRVAHRSHPAARDSRT